MTERFHELWYRPGFKERLTSFKSNEKSMSVQINKDIIISISTPDGIPSHAEIKTINLEGWREKEPTTIENLFSFYDAAEIADPDNPLTDILKHTVLSKLAEETGELEKKLDSAWLLTNQIKARHGSPAWEYARALYRQISDSKNKSKSSS